MFRRKRNKNLNSSRSKPSMKSLPPHWRRTARRPVQNANRPESPKKLADTLTRWSSATAGKSEPCFHFIVHNSSFAFSVRRPAVGCSDWLDDWVIIHYNGACLWVVECATTPSALETLRNRLCLVNLCHRRVAGCSDMKSERSQR